MNEYHVKITRQAREHLRDIGKYIEFELMAPVAAKNILSAIKEELKSLSSMPDRIHLTPEQPWHDQGVHRDRVRNFYIYFFIDETLRTVHIIDILYVFP